MVGELPTQAGTPGGAVFLSYASEDAEAAERICESLRAGGIEVWFDQSELRGGDAWDAAIRKQIKACRLFIPVISVSAHARIEGYFRLEWKLAVDRSHFIAPDQPFLLPVVIDGTPQTDERIPDRFRELQWSRLPGGETSGAFVERVQRLVSADPETTGEWHAAHVQAFPAARSHPHDAGSHSLLRTIIWAVTAVILVVVLGYYAFNWPARQPQAHVSPGQAPVVTGAIPEKSIAVLPFVDMSEKKDQEYFSDGISEEMIDLLSKVPDLKVSARTSSFYFKSQHATAVEIARALGVAHLLEGSVRKAGDTIRVTAELVRADNGYHLWSETYDRNFTDIFKLQDEIATAVVTALKAQLLPSVELTSSHQTGNAAAYAQYLIGNRFRYADTPESNQEALVAYQKAIALDPRYAAAYAAMSEVEWRLADMSTGDPAGYARAAAAAEQAISLAPQSADGYWAHGRYRYATAFDWRGGEADFKKALTLNPNLAPARVDYATVLAMQGRLAQAVVELHRALTLDPLSADASYILTRILWASGERAEARQIARAMVDRNMPGGHETAGYIALLDGNAAQADAEFRMEPLHMVRLYTTAVSQYSLGHLTAADSTLSELVRDFSKTLAYQIAEVYAWRGDADKAFAWLETAYRQHDRGITQLRFDPLVTRLRSDPRYRAMLEKLGV